MDTDHRTEADRRTPPSAIEGWDWAFDESDCTWNIWKLDGSAQEPGITVERRSGSPSDEIRLAVWGEVPPEIVAAVYTANRRQP